MSTRDGRDLGPPGTNVGPVTPSDRPPAPPPEVGFVDHLPDDVVRTVIEASPDGLAIVSDDGRVLYANGALCEMFRWDVSALVGRPVEVLLAPDDRDAHHHHRQAYVTAPTVRPMGQGMRLTGQRGDGTTIFVEVSLSPVASGDVVHTIATVRDVTGRLASEEALRRSDEGRRVAEERERIARDLHDTVLQRLFGLGLELQTVGMRTEPEHRERIERAVDELDRIIRDIRTTVFTLGATDRHGSLAQELAGVTAQAARVLGFAPRVRLDGPVESTLTDLARIDLIASLREALGNVARHARATNVTVEITAGEYLVLEVRDDGVGLGAPGDRGIGHGLTNLTARAQRFGGTCSIEDHPEGGAVLRWQIPSSR